MSNGEETRGLTHSLTARLTFICSPITEIWSKSPMSETGYIPAFIYRTKLLYISYFPYQNNRRNTKSNQPDVFSKQPKSFLYRMMTERVSDSFKGFIYAPGSQNRLLAMRLALRSRKTICHNCASYSAYIIPRRCKLQSCSVLFWAD